MRPLINILRTPESRNNILQELVYRKKRGYEEPSQYDSGNTFFGSSGGTPAGAGGGGSAVAQPLGPNPGGGRGGYAQPQSAYPQGYPPATGGGSVAQPFTGSLPSSTDYSRSRLGSPEIVQGLYSAARKNGFTDAGARHMIGEINRENGLAPNLIWGSHSDPADKATNSGIISWQGNRRDNLMTYLGQNGAIDQNGKMIQNQGNLDAQFGFMAQEMQKTHPQAYQYFTNPDVNFNNDQATRLMGGSKGYIGWALDNPKYQASGLHNLSRGYDIADQYIPKNSTGTSDQSKNPYDQNAPPNTGTRIVKPEGTAANAAGFPDISGGYPFPTKANPTTPPMHFVQDAPPSVKLTADSFGPGSPFGRTAPPDIDKVAYNATQTNGKWGSPTPATQVAATQPGSPFSDVVGGRSSAAVLARLQQIPQEQLSGAHVVLSPGVSNDAHSGDYSNVQKQFDYLKGAGAKVSVVGMGTNYKTENPVVQKMATDAGFNYVPAGNNDGIHMSPSGYSGVLNQAIATNGAPTHIIGDSLGVGVNNAMKRLPPPQPPTQTATQSPPPQPQPQPQLPPQPHQVVAAQSHTNTVTAPEPKETPPPATSPADTVLPNPNTITPTPVSTTPAPTNTVLPPENASINSSTIITIRPSFTKLNENQRRSMITLLRPAK